ncbi:MAG: TMEM143 family protein, partial [Planctomycetota bacterium]
KLDVDLDDFAEVLIFRRERRTSTETVKRLRGMVKPKVVDVAMYDRVVVYIRFKDAAYFEQRKKKNLPFTPGESTLKLFQNVPETGLEMLFPNAKARMRIKDKLVLGLPSAIAGFGVLGKLYATIGAIFLIIAVTLRISDKQVNVTADSLVGLMLALFGIGLFMRKQINKFKGRKVKHLMTLAKNLYFKVLDNNAGVFHHLIDAAEEEDCKEAILAYYFLLTRRSDFTEPALDREVEKWFAEKHDTTLDFEVDDAMGKLERLELAYREGDVLRVKPLDESKKRIDWLWDNFFAYND